VKKLVTFGYVVGVFLPRKFKLISEKFKSSTKNGKTCIFGPITSIHMLWICSGVLGVEEQLIRWTRICVVLTAIAFISEKERCDFLKKYLSINKLK
jgi:hypothetical protein